MTTVHRDDVLSGPLQEPPKLGLVCGGRRADHKGDSLPSGGADQERGLLAGTGIRLPQNQMPLRLHCGPGCLAPQVGPGPPELCAGNADTKFGSGHSITPCSPGCAHCAELLCFHTLLRPSCSEWPRVSGRPKARWTGSQGGCREQADAARLALCLLWARPWQLSASHFKTLLGEH